MSRQGRHALLISGAPCRILSLVTGDGGEVTPMATATAIVGKKIHDLLWERRIPQRQLADHIDIDQSTLSRKLRGDRPWTLDEVFSCAGFFDVPLSDLIPERDSFTTTDRYLGEILGEITPPDDPPSRPNRRAIPGGVESVRHRRSSVIPALRQPEAEHRQPSRQRSAAVPARNRTTGAAVRAAA